jgi:hypothetical protein
MKKPRPIRKLRYSCITGKAVWACFATSYKAEWKAYKKACEAEIERVRTWSEHAAEYRNGILRALNKLTSSIPIGQEMTPEQRAAARAIKKLADTPLECDMEFYNHIMEERRRKAEDKAIREQMKKRRMLENEDYGK